MESDDFNELLKNIKVSMIAVDEAHCVSQWGHDFRPSYLNIKHLREICNNPIISVFTATATPSVKKDIVNLIGLKNQFEKPLKEALPKEITYGQIKLTLCKRSVKNK